MFCSSKCPEGSNHDYQQGAYFLSFSLHITSTARDCYEITSKERASFLSPKAQNPQFVWSAKSWACFLIGWRHNRGTLGQIIWLEREPEPDHRRWSLVSSRTTFKLELGNSLVVWWLGFYASTAGSMGSIPLGGTRSLIPHSAATHKKREKKVKCASSTPWFKKKRKTKLELVTPHYGPQFSYLYNGQVWGMGSGGRRLLHPKFPQELPRFASYNLPPNSPSQPKQAFMVTMGACNTQRIWIHTWQEKMVVVPSPQMVGASQSREEVEQRREVKRRERKEKDWKIMKGRSWGRGRRKKINSFIQLLRNWNSIEKAHSKAAFHKESNGNVKYPCFLWDVLFIALWHCRCVLCPLTDKQGRSACFKCHSDPVNNKLREVFPEVLNHFPWKPLLHHLSLHSRGWNSRCLWLLVTFLLPCVLTLRGTKQNVFPSSAALKHLHSSGATSSYQVR